MCQRVKANNTLMSSACVHGELAIIHEGMYVYLRQAVQHFHLGLQYVHRKAELFVQSFLSAQVAGLFIKI